MSNLDNLIKKIIADAQEEANLLIRRAEEKQKEIIAQKETEAKKKTTNLLDEAKRKADRIKEQAVSSAKIKARDEVLKAKGEVIHTVFTRALEELKQLDDESYLQFLKKRLENMNLGGTESLVVPESKRELVSRLGIPVQLEEKESVESGFLLISEKFVFNQTFESILDYERDRLELAVARVLFD